MHHESIGNSDRWQQNHIESLFGKYKQFSARCPIKEMGQMLLTICLSTMNLTTTIVKKALESISFFDVEEWLAEVFGQSMLSKRKEKYILYISELNPKIEDNNVLSENLKINNRLIKI